VAVQRSCFILPGKGGGHAEESLLTSLAEKVQACIGRHAEVARLFQPRALRLWHGPLCVSLLSPFVSLLSPSPLHFLICLQRPAVATTCTQFRTLKKNENKKKLILDWWVGAAKAPAGGNLQDADSRRAVPRPDGRLWVPDWDAVARRSIQHLHVSLSDTECRF